LVSFSFVKASEKEDTESDADDVQEILDPGIDERVTTSHG
jgi:hypothetical protein